MTNKTRSQMNDLKKRLLLSSFSALIVVLLIVYAHLPFMGILLALVVATLAGVATWEFGKFTEAKGLKVARRLMIQIAILEVLALFAGQLLPSCSLLPILIPFVALLAFFIAHFKTPVDAILEISTAFFSVMYIAIPLGMMLGILYFSPPTFDGRWWLFYLIFVTKITDIGGYFIGRFLGKHPLAPILSPNKTIEGSLAGLICSIALSVGFHYLGQAYSQGGFHLTLYHSLWLGALLGLVGQIGDLGESLFKRDANVKDSNTLPGLGGILDMVDSLLLTTPVVYLFVRAVT